MPSLGGVSLIAGFVYTVLAVIAAVAAAWVFNRQRAKQLTDLQNTVIALIEKERDALKDRVVQLEDTIATIRVALKRRGIYLRINGEYVTLEDRGTPVSGVLVQPQSQMTQRIRKEQVRAEVDDDDQ